MTVVTTELNGRASRTEWGPGRREQVAGGKGNLDVHAVGIMKAKVALQDDVL